HVCRDHSPSHQQPEHFQPVSGVTNRKKKQKLHPQGKRPKGWGFFFAKTSVPARQQVTREGGTDTILHLYNHFWRDIST
ncbi:MAG: hypothetical protein MR712_08280, partial [Bacteroidales bacterium]|nr:hypothetical protein [Bacteroidales bacterium]